MTEEQFQISTRNLLRLSDVTGNICKDYAQRVLRESVMAAVVRTQGQWDSKQHPPISALMHFSRAIYEMFAPLAPSNNDEIKALWEGMGSPRATSVLRCPEAGRPFYMLGAVLDTAAKILAPQIYVAGHVWLTQIGPKLL